MQKLNLESIQRLTRDEMKKIMAGDSDSDCSGSCQKGTSVGECYTAIFGDQGCHCSAVGIGGGECGG